MLASIAATFPDLSSVARAIISGITTGGAGTNFSPARTSFFDVARKNVEKKSGWGSFGSARGERERKFRVRLFYGS